MKATHPRCAGLVFDLDGTVSGCRGAGLMRGRELVNRGPRRSAAPQLPLGVGVQLQPKTSWPCAWKPLLLILATPPPCNGRMHDTAVTSP